MCFSATASFIAGATTVGVGALTVTKTKSKREIPLASISILFGIQQLIEGTLWLSFNLPVMNIILTYSYLLYALVWWPFFMPIAVFLVEENEMRKKILSLFIFLGIIVGLYFLLFIIIGPVASRIVNNSIGYNCSYPYTEPTFALYVIITCMTCFISSHKMIKIFGAVALLSLFIAYQFYNVTFTSVWCFFAAILSLIIYFHFRHKYQVKDSITDIIQKTRKK